VQRSADSPGVLMFPLLLFSRVLVVGTTFGIVAMTFLSDFEDFFTLLVIWLASYAMSRVGAARSSVR
jgi:hypothetical protein